jgi:iron complex outermembrane receptor protein
MKMSTKSKLLLSAVSFSLMMATAAPTYAQDSDEDVVVTTGTRLNVNPNLTAAQPVLSIDAGEISARGIVNIEDLTNSLPQISAAQTSEQSNGASGTAQLDLRGLGAQRTLTLIDGRRLPYGDSSSVAVNLDLVLMRFLVLLTSFLKTTSKALSSTFSTVLLKAAIAASQSLKTF